MDSSEIRKKHKEFLFPCVANYYAEPLILTHGQGELVYDSEGKEYLDFFCGILTTMLGHSHPRVNASVIQQIEKLQHTSTLYQNIPPVKLAEKMALITPGELKQSFFTNSGSEADETAVLAAKKFTGRDEVIALRHAYSGRSNLAMNLTAHAGWRQAGSTIAGIKHAHNPYCYRCALHLEYPACDLACATDLEELIQTTTSGKIAAFIAEPIQGVGGFIIPPKEYFKVAADIIRKYGGVFISDEVQTGFGRTGGKWFGIEHWDVEPEIMTFAKGMANGFPIGATIATAEVAESMAGLHISTFGGNPVSTSAALATIDVVEKDNLLEHVDNVGEQLIGMLKELQKKYRAIGDVRGKGLMIGIEVVGDNKTPDPGTVLKVFESTKAQGLLIGKGGLYGNVIRVTPPLNIKMKDIERAVQVLDKAFKEVS
ncbi:MAG: aspartate aminotransferase family protein [candidate division Zixibacteria bacterium]|nr:aspartate aminotransferase family protein [candidate division Zixibacteria bacterium]